MPLHEDTQAFLAMRNAFRDALASALLTAPEPHLEDPEEPEDPEDPEDLEDPKDPECIVPGQPGSGGTDCNPFEAIDRIPPIECFRDAQGWPASPGLYADLLDSLRSQGAENIAEAQIPLQLQVNVIESYRKMLLHKKQRLCHYMASWCACMRREPQSQSELTSLMLNRPIGRVVDDNDGTDNPG